MKIYLVGVPGFPNYGDELIFKNWVYFLADKYPDAEIWIDTPHPTIIHSYFNNINIKVTNAVWRLSCDCYHENKTVFATALQDKILRLGTPDYDLAVLNLRSADVFHIIGGGYINSLWKKHTGILHTAAVLKQAFGIKTYATGAGLLPPAYEPEDYAGLLKHFDYCESRDKQGSLLLGIPHGYDDAYLDKVCQRASFPEERVPDVMISIQHDTIDGRLFDQTVAAVFDRIAEYRQQSLSVGYIEAIPGKDRTAFEYLKDLIPQHLFFNAVEIITHGLPVKPGQVWYSTRFHHHLEASLLGLKGVALSIGKEYYSIKHQSLLDNGTGWNVWTGTTENLPYPDLAESFQSKCREIISAKNATANLLYP